MALIQVLEGMELVDRISRMKVDGQLSPIQKVVIQDCGKVKD